MTGYHADRNLGRNVIRRVEVVAVDDTGEIQKVTCVGLADEYFDLPLRGQPHGLTGVPRVGAIGYVFMSNGRADQAFLLSLEHPEDRPTSRADGETTMYASQKQEVYMDKNGNTRANTPNGIFYINSDVPSS